jgi:hypothetical protein
LLFAVHLGVNAPIIFNELSWDGEPAAVLPLFVLLGYLALRTRLDEAFEASMGDRLGQAHATVVQG